MKRPLLPVALLLIAGILCGELARPGLPLLFGASFAVAAAALAWNKGRVWLAGLLVFLTGWTNASWHAAIISGHDLRLLLGDRARTVSLRGTIVAPPSQRIYERDKREFWRSSALIETSEICLNDAWEPAVGRVVAGAPGLLPASIFEGQRVEVRGDIQPPRGPIAEGLFNPRAFYRREGVFFQLQTYTTNDWKALPEGGTVAGRISERFRQWAKKTLALGLPEEDQPLRLTWTLLLDWKAPLSGSVEEPFMRAGTYHIFAVDGLRIGLLAGIGLGLLRLLRIPRALCGLLVLPMLWFYAGLTGWPASAVRATIMMTVVIVGWACRRPGDLINSLFAAAIIVLLWEPAQPFQPGFQLSFLVVLCIGVILPRARQRLRAWLFKGDPFLPDSLQSRGPIFLRTPADYALDTATLSFAAWVGSIPLAAYYFHLFTPVSLPANCVVVPVTALALMSGMGSLLTGAWLPGLAGLFNNATWALMKFILWFSQCAAKWPWGNFNAAAPSLGVCLFYYALLLLAATGWLFRSRHRRAAAAALMAAGLGLAGHWAWGLRAARLEVLPLNGAPVILARPPGLAGKLLIDCGNEKSAREFLTPFLCAQGVNRLAGLCLAGGRLAFFGGAKVILTNFSVAEVFTGAAQDRSPPYRGLMRDLRPAGSWRSVKDGDSMAGWTVLHPGPSDQFPQADDNAVALQRRLNGQSVLLLPALGRDGQEALMRHHPELRADIVVAGLPAREEPLCDPLLDLLRPGLIVIADAKFPATSRAPEKLRQRLARHAARVVYVRDNGALTLEIGPRSWSMHTADGEPAIEAQRSDSGEPAP
jgi:ComEC/Rec2-related protein